MNRDVANRADVLGCVLAVAAAAWTLVAAGDLGTPALGMAAVLVAVPVVVLLAHWVTRRRDALVPSLVVLAPVLLGAVPGRALTGEGPLGYENASAALYVLACAAALLLASRVDTMTLRRGCWAAAFVAALLVFLSGSEAASLLVCAVIVVAVFASRRVTGRIVMVGGAALVLVALVATVALGALHEPGPRAGPADRLVDATLGDLRPIVWSDALAHVRAAPVTGTGPGTFAEASGVADRRPAAVWAHSAYLEVAAETGVVGLALVLGLLGWGGHRLRHATCRPCANITAAALVAVALHASIDHVLHFPAVVVALAAVVGAGSAGRAAGHVHPAPPAGNRHGTVDLPRRGAASGAPVLVVSLAVVTALLLLPLGVTNPVHTAANGAQRDAGGLHFGAPGLVRTPAAPESLYQALVDAGAFSVVVEVSPASLAQEGPARILSSSAGPSYRNLTLGQEGDALVIRLRTSTSNLNATDSELVVTRAFTQSRRTHVAVTYDGAATRVYVDGRLRDSQPGTAGDLSTWDFSFPLLMGNELGGNRPWLGSVHRVGVYGEALQANEISARTQAPATTRPLAAYAFAGEGAVINDLSERHPAVDLALPGRYQVAPGSFTQAFLAAPWTVYGPVGAALLVLVHAGVFAALAGILRRAITVGRPIFRAGTSIAACVALAGLVEYVQYTQGRSPSAAVVVSAGVGALVGAALLPAARGVDTRPER